MDKNNKTIFANTKEPFILGSRVEPFIIGFTLYKKTKGNVGGLSYASENIESELTPKVRLLYKEIYNVTLPDDAHIVFGIGSVQLMTAYFYAAQKIRNKPTTVSFYSKSIPRFAFYKGIVEITKNCKFVESEGDVNCVISPMNPSGELFKYDSKLNKGFVLFDLFYDNPMYTGKFSTVSEDVYKIFNENKDSVVCNSFSAFGMAGTRCGFFILRNPDIVNEMRNYLYFNTISNSSNFSIGNNAITEYFLKKTFYTGPHNRLRNRLTQFLEVAKKLNIPVLNKTFFIPFVYTGKSANWWKENVNVKTAPGSEFDDTNDNSRLSLMIPQIEWDVLIDRLEKLVPS